MKFERPKGFIGGEPRDWIDKNLPNCPFCKKLSLWEVGFEFKFGFNRYHFRCPNCLAIFSIPVVAIVQPMDMTVFFLKKAATTNLKVESMGTSKTENLVGKEYSLQELQIFASS